MKSNTSRLLSAIVLAITLAGSAFGQLNYSSDASGVALFNGYKADGAFVTSTLLNLSSVTSFTKGGLTFNLIPNLDPSSPSDIQVGPGFTVDVQALASNHGDLDNFGSESSLLGAGNQTLYPNFGPASTLTWHINAPSVTDVVFWDQDVTISGMTKFTMDDPLAFRTYTAADINYLYYIFGIDDRRNTPGSDHDYNDMVVGVRLNLQPVGIEAVPEPSTYGALGGAALAVITAVRRIRKKGHAV